MGLRNSLGPLCIRTAQEAITETVYIMSLERGRSSSGCRNPGDVGKGRNSRKSDEGEGLCVKCIPKDRGEIPMINLKKLNEHVHTEHFNMEGIHLLKDLLRKGDCMDDESGPS